MFELKYRELLPPIVAEELDSLTRELNSKIETAHDPDGGLILPEPVAGMYFKLSNQSINNNTITAITFSAAPSPTSSSPNDRGWNLTRDDGSMLKPDSAGNLTLLQPPPIDGLYLITANIEWDSNNNGKRRLTIYDPESALDLPAQEGVCDATVGIDVLYQNVSVMVNWRANDRLGYQVRALQTSGGALNAVATNFRTWAQITLVQEFTR